MSRVKNVLLMIGSPKGTKSVSHALGTYLLERITAAGAEGQEIFIQAALKADPDGKVLVQTFEEADLILLVFPLYVDSLPHPVIEALETLSALQARKPAGRKSFAAVCNCGFPEARQIDLALAMCRQFAKQASLDWMGGLALGGGGAIAGRDIKEGTGPVRHVQKALDMAADALIEYHSIPDEAVKLMARSAVPTWLYLLIGNLGWWIEAWKNGVLFRLRERPYRK